MMSSEGLPTSYLNFGFEDVGLESSGNVATNVADQTDNACDKGNAGQAIKIDRTSNRVHYFRRNPAQQTEETSLLESQSEVNVAYFVKPKHENSAFKFFRRKHICVTLADYLHKLVYICLIANFILFARSYLECSIVNSMVTTFAVVICCTLTSAAFIFFIDILPKKLAFVFIGFFSYLIGLGLMVWIAKSALKHMPLRWCSVLALFLVCLGEAATKTSLPELGNAHSTQEEIGKTRQFVWRQHWISNLVFLIIICIITAIQQNVNFEVAFCISIGLILMAFVLFLVPFKQYKVYQVSHTGTFRLVWNILKEARKVKQSLHRSKTGSAVVEEDDKRQNTITESWIDFAMSSQGGTYEESEVNAVKCLYDVTLIFVCLIPYWIVHAQCYSTYFYQGMHLDSRVGDTNFPIAWLNIFNIVVVMALAPMFDMVIYPALESCDISFPVVWRMLSGLICGSISLIIAGCIEISGISHANSKGLITQNVGKLEVTAVNLSIFVQIPQYFFLALSEVFTAFTALNIAHRLCTGGFRRLASGMYFVTISAGHILALIIIILGWYPEQGYFIDSSVQTYFFVLAAFMVVNACILALVIYKMIDIPSRLRIV